MSENDSFLDEVTEELRRDQMVAAGRKYAPFIIAVLVLLIGGIGVNEYLKSSARQAAEAKGDAMLKALTEESAEARHAQLEALVAEGGDAEALAQLHLAGSAVNEGDLEQATELLGAIAADPGAPTLVKDLARLKLALLGEAGATLSDRRAILEQLSADGHPFRLLATEQQAYLALEEGQEAEAFALFGALLSDPAASRGMQQRVLALQQALGVEFVTSDAQEDGAEEESDG